MALLLLDTNTWKTEMSFSGKIRLFGSSEDGKESEFLKKKWFTAPFECQSASSEKFEFLISWQDFDNSIDCFNRV